MRAAQFMPTSNSLYQEVFCMKHNGWSNYIKIFVLAVLIIAVYKTFDNLGYLAQSLGHFFKLLYPVFWAFAVAFLLYPMCLRIENLYKKCNVKFIHAKRRGLSVLTVFAVFLTVIAVLISSIIPALVKSARELFVQLPNMVDSFIRYISDLGIVDMEKFYNSVSIEKIIEKLDFSDASVYIHSVAGASSFFVNALMTIIISIYILADRHNFKVGAKRVWNLFVKADTRELITPYLRLTYDFMYKYIGCMLLDAFVVFCISMVVLLLLRVKYAPLLALMIGVMNIIPYFGAIISGILTALITLVTGTWSKAVIVGVCLLVMQQIDGNVIQPHIVKDSLQITPFWVLVAILIGGGLFGFWGIIVAVPFMALFQTIFGDVLNWRERKMAEKNE